MIRETRTSSGRYIQVPGVHPVNWYVWTESSRMKRLQLLFTHRRFLRINRCVGCDGILLRPPRLRKTGNPAAYHHKCMEERQRFWAARDQRDLDRWPNPCNICGEPLR